MLAGEFGCRVLDHFVARRSENPGKELADRLFLLDDQDAQRDRRHRGHSHLSGWRIIGGWDSSRLPQLTNTGIAFGAPLAAEHGSIDRFSPPAVRTPFIAHMTTGGAFLL